MQGPRFLSAEQLLLTTLVVKLAAMAALATMLVRYHRFRQILIFERRTWPDRLVFALGLAVPLAAGVCARLLLGYDAADLTMEGSFLAGLIAGPYAGATVGGPRRRRTDVQPGVDRPPLCHRMRVCRRRPARAVSQGSDLALFPVHLHQPAAPRVGHAANTAGRLAGRSAARPDRARAPGPGAWLQMERSSPAVRARAVAAVVLDDAPGPAGDGAVGRNADQDLEQRADRAPVAGAGEAAAGSENRRARQPDQPAFPLQHPRVDLFPHPHEAGNRANAHHEAVRAAAAPDAQRRIIS